jgi:hypothetical protein
MKDGKAWITYSLLTHFLKKLGFQDFDDNFLAFPTQNVSIHPFSVIILLSRKKMRKEGLRTI